MKKAVIDIGTNSTRLYVAEILDGKQNKILKMLSTTRLGEGIIASDTMGDIPMKRTSDKVKEFADLALKNGAEEIYIYATAVVREAKNRDAFAGMIYEKTEKILDIIPGEVEGKIAFMGASAGYARPAVIDIGGGSTEVVTCKNTLRALSQKTGGVRLKEKFDKGAGIVDIGKVKAFVAESYLKDFGKFTDITAAETLIGVSGTPTTLYSLFNGIKTYSPDKIQGGIFNKTDLDCILEKTALMDTETLRVFSGDFSPRADIVVYGGCILAAFMEYYGFKSIVVSDRDSLEGYMELKNEG